MKKAPQRRHDRCPRLATPGVTVDQAEIALATNIALKTWLQTPTVRLLHYHGGVDQLRVIDAGTYGAAGVLRRERQGPRSCSCSRLGGDQQDGFDAELSTFDRDGLVLGPIVGAFGDMSSHVDLLADEIADALTA